MNERELLLAALARNDAQARTQYLERACADDAALRDRIDALLKLHEETGGFLEESAAHESGSTSDQTTPGDSNASSAQQGTGANPSHSGGRTQADVEATEAFTPGAVAHATGATGDTDTGTPRTADFDATADGLTDPLDLTHGTTVRHFGDYEILKELGRGGMGVV